MLNWFKVTPLLPTWRFISQFIKCVLWRHNARQRIYSDYVGWMLKKKKPGVTGFAPLLFIFTYTFPFISDPYMFEKTKYRLFFISLLLNLCYGLIRIILLLYDENTRSCYRTYRPINWKTIVCVYCFGVNYK